ncbi:unnamed protein product [Toxocara canis]|uniref:Solute carrier family 23 member 2 n=1 Tax=Toxocara canis TaxID=6265 RepID=A0A183U7B3_TOXCA|nr:unnamed protein product [Toxocara canis]
MISDQIKIPLPPSPSTIETRWLPWTAGLGSAVWLCALANFINSADRVIMPIAIGGLSAEYDYTLVQQGWILSAFPAGYISSQVSITYPCIKLHFERLTDMILDTVQWCCLFAHVVRSVSNDEGGEREKGGGGGEERMVEFFNV